MAKTNGTVRWIAVVVTVILAAVVVIYGYGLLNGRVDAQEKAQTSHNVEDEARDIATELRVRATEMATVRMESDIGHIKTDMIEQKALSKEILEEIRREH